MLRNSSNSVLLFGVLCLAVLLVASCSSQAGITKSAASAYAIKGIVYYDANANATYDTGDVLLNGVAIGIVDNSVNPPLIVAQTQTNSAGYYELAANDSTHGSLMFTGREKGDDYIPPGIYIYEGGSQDIVQNFRTEVLPTY